MVTDLTPRTKYYFRIAAVSEGEAFKGEYLSFHTLKRLGLYVTDGDESGSAGFRALEYPTQVSFKPFSSNPPKIRIGSTSLVCGENYYYVAEMTAAQETLTVFYLPYECEFGSLGAVEVSSGDVCGFDISLADEAFPFGGLGISCVFEGPGITIQSNFCEIVIPVQYVTPIASVVQNLGEDEGGKVETAMATTVEYEKTGSGCEGVSGSASIEGGGTLAATG